MVAAVIVGFAMIATTALAYTHSITLRQGSSGSQVVELQKTLNITADGKFGPMTRAAVVAFQTSKGLTADGVVGPMTGAALGGTSGPVTPGCQAGWTFNPVTGQACGNNNPTNPGGPLSGGYGSISAMTQLSQYTNEEVGAGSDDVTVLGFEIEASEEGDIQFPAIKLVFSSTGNDSGDSDRLEDYLSSVSVLQGSKEIANVDADDFTKVSTGVYSKVVVLSNAIVRAGDKESFYVNVSAVGNLDSADIDSDSWTVAIENIRVLDGSGVTSTDVTSVPADIDYDTAGDGVAISFVTFSAASDTELKISANNTPDATTIAVENSEDTDDVVLLKGRFQVEGDSDIWIDEIPILFTATGESVVATTASVTLEIDGQTFSETVSAATSTATITFNDLELTLDAGDSYNFTVSADINDIEDTSLAVSDFDVGDTLSASLTTTNRASIVAENEEGDSLTDATEKTGSATGNAMTFRTEGVNVVMGTPDYEIATHSTSGDTLTVKYSIPVAVTSFGNTLYMGQSGQLAATATGSNAFALVFEEGSTPTTDNTTSSASIAISAVSNVDMTANAFTLNEDDTENFLIEVTLTTPGASTGGVSAGNFRVKLDDIRVSTSSILETAASMTSIDLSPDSAYRTGFKYINS